jgi:spermidine synthase
VVVTEIVPEVVEAARTHFSPFTNHLFEDRRAQVVAEDGRNYLLGSEERFDVIVADLFMPWKAGTGTLYSLEHFAAARERLNDGGIFVQWLPLYQISRGEFGVISKTMLEAFPQVTLWRGDFFSEGPIVALVGQLKAENMDSRAVRERLRQAGPEVHDLPLRHFIPEIDRFAPNPGAAAETGRFLIYYCGNLTGARHLFEPYGVNRDDRPILEYRAPISHRKEASGSGSWFVTGELIDFLEELLKAVPPEQDPYLAEFSGREIHFVRAGLNFHRMQVLEITGDREGAQRAFEAFRRVVLAGSEKKT